MPNRGTSTARFPSSAAQSGSPAAAAAGSDKIASRRNAKTTPFIRRLFSHRRLPSPTSSMITDDRSNVEFRQSRVVRVLIYEHITSSGTELHDSPLFAEAAAMRHALTADMAKVPDMDVIP